MWQMLHASTNSHTSLSATSQEHLVPVMPEVAQLQFFVRPDALSDVN